jgi:hypothetical protein
MPCKVRVTVYRENLVIETLPPFTQSETFIPNGDGRFGCVLLDTATNLGVSQEALDFMRKVPRGSDDVGDIMWWGAGTGESCFAWFGGPCAVKSNPKGLVTDRDFRSPVSDYTLIPNDTGSGAMEHLDLKYQG